MEESGIIGWLHSKGEVITVFIYIQSELRLPLKESFSAFFAFIHKLVFVFDKMHAQQSFVQCKFFP